MIGTITKRPRRDGKPALGYSFFAGRTSDGKRIQITKSGFDSRKQAADALRKAIEQHRSGSVRANSEAFSAFLNRWLEEYALSGPSRHMSRMSRMGQSDSPPIEKMPRRRNLWAKASVRDGCRRGTSGAFCRWNQQGRMPRSSLAVSATRRVRMSVM